MIRFYLYLLSAFFLLGHAEPSEGWFDETHLAIAKAAGYAKWFNAVGPDMIKEKMGNKEWHNHFVKNSRGTVITPETVLGQTDKYNRIDDRGHLYGAIIASLRDYLREKQRGKYGEYHLAFCAHYVGDLSQPLHNTEHDLFNLTYHKDIDGIINEDILNHLDRITVSPLIIDSEQTLAQEIAQIANQAMILGYKLEDEKRLLTEEEAYRQVSRSTSLFRAILEYAKSTKALLLPRSR